MVQSDCSVSSLSLSLRNKEREREKREIKHDNEEALLGPFIPLLEEKPRKLY